MAKKKKKYYFDIETTSMNDDVNIIKGNNVEEIQNMINKSIENARNLPPIKFGFQSLDEKLSKGFEVGQIGHIGLGHTGKTPVMDVFLMHRMMKVNHPIVFNPEFSSIGIADRIAAYAKPKETMIIRNYIMEDFKPDCDILGVRLNQVITLYWGQTVHKAKITSFSNKTRMAEATIGKKKFLIYKDKKSGKFEVSKQMK